MNVRSSIVLAAVLAFQSVPAAACPMCLGGRSLSVSAQELVYASRSVLALPDSEATSFRVVETIKGDTAPGTIIAGKVLKLDPVAVRGSKVPLLLIKDDPWENWVNFGSINADRAPWLRQLAATRRSTAMSLAEWCEHVGNLCGFLHDTEPMVAEIATAELASAPYVALRSLKPKIDSIAIRNQLAQPEQASRSLSLLLLGIAATSEDTAWITAQLDAAAASQETTDLAALVSANLEAAGASRVDWIEENYLANAKRTGPEIEAVILALSQHGKADAVVPRNRVIEAYRILLASHPEHAGLVAPDLAEWQCWEFRDVFAKLTHPEDAHCSAEHEAVLDFLRLAKESAKP